MADVSRTQHCSSATADWVASIHLTAAVEDQVKVLVGTATSNTSVVSTVDQQQMSACCYCVKVKAEHNAKAGKHDMGTEAEHC